MSQNIVLGRTWKGDREISTREYKLEAQLRAILIMTNGKTTYAELLNKFKEIDDIEIAIEALIVNDFICDADDI